MSPARGLVGSTEFSYALAGAILLELSLMGRVDIAERGESVSPGDWWYATQRRQMIRPWTSPSSDWQAVKDASPVMSSRCCPSSSAMTSTTG